MSPKPPDTSNEKEVAENKTAEKKPSAKPGLTPQYRSLLSDKKSNKEFVKTILKLSREPEGGTPSHKKRI